MLIRIFLKTCQQKCASWTIYMSSCINKSVPCEPFICRLVLRFHGVNTNTIGKKLRFEGNNGFVWKEKKKKKPTRKSKFWQSHSQSQNSTHHWTLTHLVDPIQTAGARGRLRMIFVGCSGKAVTWFPLAINWAKRSTLCFELEEKKEEGENEEDEEQKLRNGNGHVAHSTERSSLYRS